MNAFIFIILIAAFAESVGPIKETLLDKQHESQNVKTKNSTQTYLETTRSEEESYKNESLEHPILPTDVPESNPGESVSEDSDIKNISAFQSDEAKIPQIVPFDTLKPRPTNDQPTEFSLSITNASTKDASADQESLLGKDQQKQVLPLWKDDLIVGMPNENIEKNSNKMQEFQVAPMQKSDAGKSKSTSSDSVEYRLVNDLLSTYNNQIRPVKAPGDVTHVFVELSLFNVLKLDTKKQVLKTNTELITKWMDVHLTWDPSKYDNISVIRLPYTDIWRPDIILYNTAESDYEAGILYTNAVIRYNGEVELVSHAIFSSICNVDIQWYPFDQQECKMYFASWTYDDVGIQLILGPADMSDYDRNPEYFLENFFGEQEQTFNPCCQNPMSTIVYHMQLQRRTKFSVFFYLMPGILINLCAVMVFSLPAESGEKIGLGINSMLAMIVFLMAMTEKLPPTEKIPLAGLYYGVCLSVITINIAFSVFILNMNIAGDRRRRIPMWLKHTIIFLTKMLRNRVPTEVQDGWGVDENRKFRSGTLVKNFESQQELDSVSLQNRKNSTSSNTLDDTNNFGELKDAFQRRAISALESMAILARKKEIRYQQEVEKESLRVQWKFISRVLDRLLFIIFFLVAFLFNCVILTSSPFEESFEYCPLGEGQCDEMTTEEIMKLAKSLAIQATKAHH